ncbi:MAG TPA: contact-dependent growth inhibition system immunity protein [Terriglobales bacterium]|jgi:contact-dependent growth inhibition (CDI) system CdiI-like immunity protein|nr:contact-dependent growth inhibition system immunity protein [Terriglobales bacterium]
MLETEMISGIDAGEYAALTRFLRGYLHQDAVVEYGSASAAAQQFRKDADERETAVVHSELERLLAETSTLSIADLNRAFQQLGGAWHFRSRKEVEQVLDGLK